MEPKFEFVGTTNSTQYNVKDKTKNNRVFHIKKIYPDGKETYCEYTTNRVNMNTVCLRCTNRKCKSTLTIETSQPTTVARIQVTPSGKNRRIFDFHESADLSDDTKYGNPHHNHVNTANCRFRDSNNECRATKHTITDSDGNLTCETDFPRNFSREYHEKIKDLVPQNPFTPNDQFLTNFNTTNKYEGNNVPAGFLFHRGVTKIDAKITVDNQKRIVRKEMMPDLSLDNLTPDMYWFAYAKSFKETCHEPLMYVYEDFIIFALPSELPRLVNSHWLLDGTFKHCNGLNNFQQTYIISLKYETPDDRVFIYPVVMILMRNKSENSYTSIFKELSKINRFYNPHSEDIYPSATSCDFEMAILKTLDTLFPNSVRRKCYFHWKQIINRMTQDVFGKAVNSDQCKYVRKILHSIPVLPVHLPTVKSALLSHLEFLVEFISPSHRVAYRAMIIDVEKRYLSSSHRFSFTGGEHYHAILHGDTDCTSSSCESLNAKFNKTVNTGFKSLVTVVESIKNFKKSYWETKLERMSQNKMRKRPSEFISRKNRLVELFQEFDAKPNRQKALDLVPFILDISSL